MKADAILSRQAVEAPSVTVAFSPPVDAAPNDSLSTSQAPAEVLESELLSEPAKLLLPPLPGRVGVFCGASAVPDKKYALAARELGQRLVAANIGLVFGGTQSGCMKAISDAVLAGGGHVVGVVPHLSRGGYSAERLTVVPTTDIESRKRTMVGLSTAIVVLPGGWGTLDELTYFMASTEALQRKIALLNVDGFFDKLSALYQKMVDSHLSDSKHPWMLCNEPSDVLKYIDPPKKPMSQGNRKAEGSANSVEGVEG